MHDPWPAERPVNAMWLDLADFPGLPDLAPARAQREQLAFF